MQKEHEISEILDLTMNHSQQLAEICENARPHNE